MPIASIAPVSFDPSPPDLDRSDSLNPVEWKLSSPQERSILSPGRMKPRIGESTL